MRVLDHNPFSVQSFQNLSRFEAVAKPGFDVIEPSDYPARYGSGRIRHLVGSFHLRHISPEHSAGSGPASIENGTVTALFRYRFGTSSVYHG